MIFNMSGGGGGGLNFKIVNGLTRPESPSEIMIWVKTELDIVNYIFGNDTPTELVTGTTWFQTGVNGKVRFNALKKNAIELSLSACKQYIGDKLSSMNAEIYQNGAWTKFSADWDGTLFNAGDQFTDITGGWVSSDGGEIGDTLTGSAYTTSSFGTKVRTAKKIPLADFSKLKVNFATGSLRQNTIAINESDTIGKAVDITKFVSTTTTGTLELDISEFPGEYYVFVISGVCQSSSNPCKFIVDNVKLE